MHKMKVKKNLIFFKRNQQWILNRPRKIFNAVLLYYRDTPLNDLRIMTLGIILISLQVIILEIFKFVFDLSFFVIRYLFGLFGFLTLFIFLCNTVDSKRGLFDEKSGLAENRWGKRVCITKFLAVLLYGNMLTAFSFSFHVE